MYEVGFSSGSAYFCLLIRILIFNLFSLDVYFLISVTLLVCFLVEEVYSEHSFDVLFEFNYVWYQVFIAGCAGEFFVFLISYNTFSSFLFKLHVGIVYLFLYKFQSFYPLRVLLLLMIIIGEEVCKKS